MTGSCVTFGQLPEEEAEFLAYLQMTGDVWARASHDHPVNPQWEPRPVEEFVARFGKEIEQYTSMCLWIGFREDVLHPVIHLVDDWEGGTLEPVYNADGTVDPYRQKRVGATQVKSPRIAQSDSPMVSYSCGRYRDDGCLSHSNIVYTYRHVHQRVDFLKWAKKLLAYTRKRTPQMVALSNANYSLRATDRLAEACRNGLKLI